MTLSESNPNPRTSSARPCPYCEDQETPGCEECSFTGEHVTTVIEVDGEPMRIHGNAVLSNADIEALTAVGRAAVEYMRQKEDGDGSSDDL